LRLTIHALQHLRDRRAGAPAVPVEVLGLGVARGEICVRFVRGRGRDLRPVCTGARERFASGSYRGGRGEGRALRSPPWTKTVLPTTSAAERCSARTRRVRLVRGKGRGVSV